LTLKNGTVHHGEFLDGKNFLIGLEMINGKVNGEGILVKSNGEKYEGRFDLGNFVSGKVQMKMYKGEQKNGKKHGNGTNFYLDHRVYYNGEFIDDNRIGRGIQYYLGEQCDWRAFDGYWIRNTWEGGLISYANGTIYEGPTYDTSREGKGVERYSSGDFYSG